MLDILRFAWYRQQCRFIWGDVGRGVDVCHTEGVTVLLQTGAAFIKTWATRWKCRTASSWQEVQHGTRFIIYWRSQAYNGTKPNPTILPPNPNANYRRHRAPPSQSTNSIYRKQARWSTPSNTTIFTIEWSDLSETESKRGISLVSLRKQFQQSCTSIGSSLYSGCTDRHILC